MSPEFIPYVAVLALALALLWASVRVLREYERAVVFTLGRFSGVRGPGLVLLVGLGQPARSPGMAAEEARQALGEGPARTGRIAAIEASDGQAQAHRSAAGRHVAGPTLVAAMDGGAWGPAIGAANTVAARFGDDEERVRAVTHRANDAATGQGAEQGHPLICEAVPSPTRA